MQQSILILDTKDTVGVATDNLTAGVAYGILGSADSLFAASDIDFGHKIALRALRPGDPVVKYGEVIGYARCAVVAGEHIHSHNMENTIG